MMLPAPRHDEDKLAAQFAKWAAELTWDHLPTSTRATAARELLDLMGDMAAGRGLLGMPPWLSAILEFAGGGRARLIGGGTAAPAVAALVNGYFVHALELDDTHDEAVLHAGAAVIAAVLAAVDHRGGVSGQELLTAMVVGIELVCRLGVATKLNLVEGGWIYSALLGHFGAAAAAAKLLTNDAEVLLSALGIAYSFTSGNHQSTREGAETKHLQPAIAGANGFTAALMAAAGLRGVRHPFLGEDGLSRVYLRNKLDTARALQDLGRIFETDRLSFKPYPSCRLTHPAVTVALELHRRLGLQRDTIRNVILTVGPQAYDVVGRDQPNRRTPRNRLDAQFSIYWCVALAIRDGRLSPRHLASDIPPGSALADLIGRITCSAEASASSRDVGACTLTATGTFGEITVTAEQAKGHPDLPLSADELIAKFATNVELAGIADHAAHELAGRLLELEHAPSIEFLFAALGAPLRTS